MKTNTWRGLAIIEAVLLIILLSFLVRAERELSGLKDGIRQIAAAVKMF